MENSLKHRLLKDIAELRDSPYPNISFIVDESDITKACLILTVESYGPMHMAVEIPTSFPLDPPRVRMDSQINHPNIYGSYICASILNTTQGYTPAYTLKGIAIQLLSFFSSDRIEQDHGGIVKLDQYRDTHSYMVGETYSCEYCGHGTRPVSIAGLTLERENLIHRSLAPSSPPPPPVSDQDGSIDWPSLSESSSQGSSPKRKRSRHGASDGQPSVRAKLDRQAYTSSPSINRKSSLESMPNEVLLLIIKNLATEDVWRFKDAAFARVGGVISKFDVIRTRELQCFCLKRDYMSVRLGVGVEVVRDRRLGSFESEFDLLSTEGFYTHGIRRSVQGMLFSHYLPLPISYGHWRRVKSNVPASLTDLAQAAGFGNVAPVKVIYSFMNNVVVKLNNSADKTPVPYSRYSYEVEAKSSLTHASEKAIESYFHLFHLLLCLASEDISIVNSANTLLKNFAAGKTSKDDCPDLGQLLVAGLVSTVDMTDTIRKSIIKEAITRNVVWMLKANPELAYLEPNKVSTYRLQKTFEASKTSYRLLMFLNLFRRVAVGSPRKNIAVLRDQAFERHGAPPCGSAKGLADSIKRIHRISTFPAFLREMGIGAVTAEWFTNFLRQCMRDSKDKGYHRVPISQEKALWLRQKKEPDVGVSQGLYPISVFAHEVLSLSFFPGQSGSRGGGYRGGRGGGRGGGGHRY